MKSYIKSLQRVLADRRGAAMSSILIGVTVVSGSMVVAGITATTLQWSANARTLTDLNRAIAVAEAGPADTYMRLTAPGSTWDGLPTSFAPVSFGGGTYQSDVYVTNDMVVINSRSSFNSARGEAAVAFSFADGDAQDPTAGPPGGSAADDIIPFIPGPGPSSPFSYLVLVGGEIDWSGNADTAHSPNGWVHANQKLRVGGSGYFGTSVSSSEMIEIGNSGNSEFISGDAHAPVIDSSRDRHIGGTKVTSSVALIPIPQINFEAYRQWAVAHGEFFDTDKQLNSSYDPNGGVLFVDGDIHLNANATFNGCYVATGNIHVNGNATVNAPNGLPALMTDAGTMKGNGNATVNGLLYVRTGDLNKLNGNLTLNGSIIGGGQLVTRGNFNLNFVDSTPTPPWNTDSGEDYAGGGGNEGESGGEGTPSPNKLYFVAWQK